MLAGTGVCLLVASGSALAQSSPPPEAVYERNCGNCHNNPPARAPSRAGLRAMSPDLIVEALTSGVMKLQGSTLSAAQRVALAEFLTGRKIGAPTHGQ